MWSIISLWFYVSQMTSDVEHLFMCLLVIVIFSLEICLFKSFVHFLKMWGFLLFSCRSTLYILYINSLSDIWFTNIFCHSVGCISILLTIYFDAEKVFNFDIVQFICFFFCAFGAISKKPPPNQKIKTYTCFFLCVLYF